LHEAAGTLDPRQQQPAKAETLLAMEALVPQASMTQTPQPHLAIEIQATLGQLADQLALSPLGQMPACRLLARRYSP
jgi:hypothetical protein